MTPYATAADAEAARRGMTWSEAAWFCYSAAVPDHWLLWHNVVFLFVVQTVAPLPLALFERLAPAVASQYKLQPRVQLPQDVVGRYFRDTMLVFMEVVGPYSLISYPIVKFTGVWMGPHLPSTGEILAQLLVYTLVEDYLQYWFHRFLHTKWGYQNIHHIHHEVTAPTGFATSNSHWAEVVISAIPTYAGPCIVPCHVIVHWLWLAIRTMHGGDRHALRLRRLSLLSNQVDPVFWRSKIPRLSSLHRKVMQEQLWFGSILMYCDYIYGTDKGYRYHQARLHKLKMKMAENKDSD